MCRVRAAETINCFVIFFAMFHDFICSRWDQVIARFWWVSGLIRCEIIQINPLNVDLLICTAGGACVVFVFTLQLE